MKKTTLLLFFLLQL